MAKKGFKHLLATPSGDLAVKPMPCTVHLDSKMYPEIKNWKIGEKYEILVRQVSKTEEKDGRVSGNFEVLPIKKADKE